MFLGEVVRSPLASNSGILLVRIYLVQLSSSRSLAKQKFCQDVALASPRYSLLGFGTFGKRDNGQWDGLEIQTICVYSLVILLGDRVKEA
jgi:hypothetical protein